MRDPDLERTMIVKQAYNELFAGRLLQVSGIFLSGVGIFEMISHENPTMLCLTMFGGLVFVAGKALRKGAMIFGQRAFDAVDSTSSHTLPPGDQR